MRAQVSGAALPTKGEAQAGMATDDAPLASHERFQTALALWFSIILIAGPAFYGAVVVVGGNLTRLVALLPFTLVGVAALVLMRTRSTALALRVVFIGVWFCSIHALVWTKGISGPAVGALLVALSFSAWVADARTTIALTALTPTVLMGLAWLESSGTMQDIGWDTTPFQKALVYSIASIGGATLGHFMAANMRRQFRRRQESERELRASNAALQAREDALRESEVRFRSVVETSRDSFWVIDRRGRFIDCNENYVRRSGYSREELLCMRVSDLDIRLTRQQMIDFGSQTANAGGAVFETVHRAKDGSTWPMEVSVTHAPYNEGQFISFGRDISERLRAEQALRESESRFGSVFRASPIGVTVSRLADGRLLEINDAALRLYGYPREEVMGRTAAELRIYRDPAQRDKLLRRIAAEGQVDGFEVDIRRANGEIATMAIYGRVIELAGEPCLITLRMDVTDRRRLEDLRLRSQKLESLGTLAGGIAHDFNNLLLAINGNAGLALQDLPPEHPVRPSVAEIARAGKRGSDLVRRLLSFSRPQNQQRELVDLRVVLGEGLAMLRATLPATVAFRTRYAEMLPLVSADPSQVHEAVVNLANNAAYAIGAAPGWIEFALEPVTVDEEHAATVPGLQPGSYVRLGVTDTGQGMDPATLGRIFDAFFTTKPVGEGTGLGLSMVHGIMKGHGGAVSVTSAPGAGTRFDLYFAVPAAAGEALADTNGATALGAGGQESIRDPGNPPVAQASQPLPPVAAPVSPRAAAPASGKQVLYVDDEDALVFLLDRVLSQRGHRVTGYTDPREALDAFRARPHEFDVVVTDLSMPGMSGFDLARELLALAPGIPVVMTSGYVRAEDEERARSIGVRELIAKPHTVDELGRVLDEIFAAGNESAC